MANRRRGEAEVEADGRVYRLRLTLGALAELEDAFSVDDLTALADRFNTGRLASRDIVAILGAAMRGAGHAVSDADVAAISCEGGVAPLAEAALAALAAAFGATSADPPRAQAE
ncbi:MAG: gene transfer agent family protein [Microvirga sp.]|nr:gene transfer agent family protein [Microvirga sp.]